METIATTDFDELEREILELFGDLRTTTTSETKIREALRQECARAEAAEAARDAAERRAAEANNSAAAAATGAANAASALATAQDQCTTLQIQLELSERQKILLEEKCVAVSGKACELEEEISRLKPLQIAQSNLQRQYTELQERVSAATDDARREISRLETELRRVEKCAAGGSEIRERARLAAVAHVRERRLATAEIQHTSLELKTANMEIMRLNVLVAELQHRLKQNECGKPMDVNNHLDAETLAELRSTLEAERAGAIKLEQALSAALVDNATLAASIRSADNISSNDVSDTPPTSVAATNVCQIDLFLAD